MLSLCLVAAFAVAAHAQGGEFVCQEDGYFPHSTRCDVYYDCYRGKAEVIECSDGLIFNQHGGGCEYPFLAVTECDHRDSQRLQLPKSNSVQCPRLNGYFEHEERTNCHEYYLCTNGVHELQRCPKNLVFDEFTGSCQWAHEGIRTDCVEQQVVVEGFACPNQTQLATNGQSLDHSRYVYNDDCRFFYVCLEGRTPMKMGCSEGMVFNDLTLNCDDPANVPDCANYYNTDAIDGPVKRRRK